MVSVFAVITAGIPYVLWRIWRANADGANGRMGSASSLRNWLHDEIAVQRDRLKGAEAAVHVLLPVAAASLGMTLFAIVLFFKPTSDNLRANDPGGRSRYCGRVAQ